MSLRFVRLLPIAALILAACGSPVAAPTTISGTPSTPTIVPFVSASAVTATPPATSAAATATPGPAWLGTGCEPDAIVADLRPIVDYAEFSLSHNYLMSVYYLNAWVVDPGLDPLASPSQIEQTSALAKRHAAVLAHLLNQGEACVASVFDQIVLTIVDPDYNTWFSGSIAPADLPPGGQPSDAEIDASIEAFAPGYVRSAATASVGRAAAPEQACAWPQARARMEERLGSGHPNAAFYYAIDDNGANAWAQWDGPADVDVFLPLFSEIAQQLACLYPEPDAFWVVYTDAYGGAQLIVAEPGQAIRLADPQALLDQLEVIYPQTAQ